MKNRFSLLCCLFCSLLAVFISVAPVFAASEEEKNFLLMYFTEDELKVVSATRSLKSISRVAENMTVITAKDIELMNAHTVADALANASGVLMHPRGGPGAVAMVSLQGVVQTRTALFIDGVCINNALSNDFDLATLPVQNIAKIEIIKGPGSSSWGSSLGGVINIITKASRGREEMKGTLSASYGERSTGDYRAEAYGDKGAFGYYVYAGRFETDGMIPNTAVTANYQQLKVSYKLTGSTTVLFNVLHSENTRGEGQTAEQPLDFADNRKVNTLLSSLSLNSSLSDEMKLSLSLFNTRDISHLHEIAMSTGIESLPYPFYTDTMKNGASAKLIWKHGMHDIVFGGDYYDITLLSNTTIQNKLSAHKEAIYINDTLSFDKLSVTPGLRYDDTRNGSFVSPSLGVTYAADKHLLLRAFAARGFSDPSFTNSFGNAWGTVPAPDLKVENVWSYQLGIETDMLKHLWLKLSAFRHDIRDGIVVETDPITLAQSVVNRARQRIQGLEAEFRTAPVWHTSLFGNGILISSKDLETGEKLIGEPKYAFTLGAKYDDEKSFRALLTGHYIWFTNDTYPYASLQPSHSSFVFDLNLIKKVTLQPGFRPELFMTAHNLSNAAQYEYEMWRNPRLWLEAGVRYKF